MKKNFTLLVFLILTVATIKAQYHQMPPNNTFQTANYFPFDTSMTGVTCYDTGYGYYVTVLPSSGTLRIITSASTVDSVPGKPYDLSLSLFSNERISGLLGAFSVKVGDSIPVIDTLERTCLPGDTIFIEINCTDAQAQYCFNYTFSCSIIPTAFPPNGNQNYSFATATPLAAGTSVDGQLGFKIEPADTLQPVYYQGVLSEDGELQIFTDVDYSSAGSPGLNVTVYDNNFNLVDSLEARIGPQGFPLMDTLTADCMPADTFYLKLSQNSISDCGWSYSLSYNLVPPVYGNDEEPNNNFAEAQNVIVGDYIDGNAYYGQDHSDDYFKFFKPDTGYLQILMNAESQIPVGNVTAYLYDYSANLLYTQPFAIGTPAQPGPGELYEQAEPEDTFYLRIKWPTNGHCGSYDFQITTSTVSSVNNLQLTPVSVMPNPSSGNFTFNLAGFHVTALQVYDMDGRVVEGVTGGQLENRLVTVGGDLEGGVYIARLFNGNEVAGIVKLVKTR